MTPRLVSTVILAMLSQLAAWAAPGDGIGGVEVGIRKKPRPGIVAQSPSAGAFDQVTFSGDRGLFDRLSPEKLPQGWQMTRPDRKTVVLSGPAGKGPLRLILAVEGELPKKISYQISKGGQVVDEKRNVVPAAIDLPEVRHSLSGLVYLPDEVRPGETLAFKAPPADALPRGTWSLGGQVVEEVDEPQWAQVNNTRSNIKGMVAALPPDGITLVPTDGSSCEDLAPLAAMMAAAKSRPQEPAGKTAAAAKERYEVAHIDGPPADASVQSFDVQPLASPITQQMKANHENAMNAIRNIKALYAVEPTGDREGISIKEKGIEVSESFSGAEVERRFWESRSNTANRAGGKKPDNAARKSFFESRSNTARQSGQELSAARKSFFESRSNTAKLVSMRGELTPDGCHFRDRELADLEIAQLSPPSPPAMSGQTGSLSGSVHVFEVPEGLTDATGLAVQFHDIYGDLVVDVPRAPVRILPPRAPSEKPPQPCIETATAFVQIQDAFCVCGSFPNPSSGWSLLLNERPMPPGATLSTSATEVWLRFPEGSAPGRYFLSGPADAGFAPSCRTTTHLIEIRGEIDSTRLLRGETVPMRLTILGSDQRVPVRVRNLTPSIIDIEGGVEQTVESSGGGANSITRSVRALQRGDFNVEWTLANAPCPCSSP